MNDEIEFSPFEHKIANALQNQEAAWTPECPDQDRILDLMEMADSDPAAIGLMKHIATCAYCRREYQDIRETWTLAREVATTTTDAKPSNAFGDRRPTTESQSSVLSPQSLTPNTEHRTPNTVQPSFWQRLFGPAVGFAFGAGAMVVVVHFFALPVFEKQIDTLKAKAAQERQSFSTRFVQQREAYVKQSAQMRQQIARLEQEKKALANRVPPQQVARVDRDIEAAMAGNLTVSPAALKLDSGQRSASEAKPITLRGPLDTFVLEDRPILEAAPQPDVTDRKVTVINPNRPDQPIKTTAKSATQWQVQETLEPGGTYEWWVEGKKNGQDVTSEIVKFRVLDRATAAQMARVRQQYATQPLTLGIFYAKAGLLDAAEQQFEQVLKTDPNHPLARKLLESLKTKRRI